MTNNSERQTLGIYHLTGPRWTEQHEASFKKMMKHYVDSESMIWPMAKRVLQNSQLILGLCFLQTITFFGLIVLTIYMFWR